jgi:alpha-D-ribose 1-methylphosphonate 5-triphosphate synthase subunit PhnH
LVNNHVATYREGELQGAYDESIQDQQQLLRRLHLDLASAYGRVGVRAHDRGRDRGLRVLQTWATSVLGFLFIFDADYLLWVQKARQRKRIESIYLPIATFGKF